MDTAQCFWEVLAEAISSFCLRLLSLCQHHPNTEALPQTQPEDGGGFLPPMTEATASLPSQVRGVSYPLHSEKNKPIHFKMVFSVPLKINLCLSLWEMLN